MQELCHIAAKDHSRGIDNMLIQFVDMNQAVLVAMRLRQYGYNKIKLFKTKGNYHGRSKE